MPLITPAQQTIRPGGSSSVVGDEEYEFIRRLVYEHSRINLGPDKRELVNARLGKRLRTIGLDDIGSYCDLLRSPAGEAELTSLLDAISTNHTHFFRESKHFDFLRQTALPAADAAPPPRGEPWRAWSAACSSGEEAYSLAILLADYWRNQPDRDWRIEGSDISTRVLASASRGIYPAARVNDVPAELQRRYFQKGYGQWAGHFRVKDALRERIRWHHHNFFHDRSPFGNLAFDVIFCRNVMIYFDRPTQEALVAKLTGYLRPGGYLFIGHAESLSGVSHQLRQIKPAIYLKPG